MAEETIAILGNHNNGKNYLLQAVGLMKCEKMNVENKIITMNSEQIYQQYLRVVDRNRVKGNTSYAKLLWTLGENDEALKYLDRAFQAKMYNAVTWYIYGMILKEKGEFNQAVVAFQNALDLCAVFKECEIVLKSTKALC